MKIREKEILAIELKYRVSKVGEQNPIMNKVQSGPGIMLVQEQGGVLIMSTKAPTVEKFIPIGNIACIDYRADTHIQDATSK